MTADAFLFIAPMLMRRSEKARYSIVCYNFVASLEAQELADRATDPVHWWLAKMRAVVEDPEKFDSLLLVTGGRRKWS